MRIEREQNSQNVVKPTENKIQRNKNVANKKQNIMMFMSIFMVLLIIFLGFAKMLSPDVDITLGDDSALTQEDDYERGIDSRLKDLQQEDDGLAEDENLIEDDGLVHIPQRESIDSLKPEVTEDTANESIENKTSKEQLEQIQEKNQKVEKVEKPAPTSPQSVAVQTPTKTYRVYVGMYATQAQAEVAREILHDAGLGVSPTIKQTGSGYSLQAGAFSSKDSATNLSNKLLLNNYPARVVSD